MSGVDQTRTETVRWPSSTRAALAACLVGGVVAGALDLIYAFAAWGVRGVEPLRILQSIASGLLGRAAFEGGAETGALGAALHFAMTTVMAGVFVFASKSFSFLRERAVQWGMIYGAGIFLVMNYIVVPLSRAAATNPPIELYLMNLCVHIFLVGLPIALITKMYLSTKRRT
jgi:hypothetical protein